MSRAAIEKVAEAGVVGAGGAGFPTYVKLSARADSVLINAAECEPLLHKDKEVLRHFADDVLAGLALAMACVGAERGIVAIKAKYADVIDQLGPKLAGNMEIAAWVRNLTDERYKTYAFDASFFSKVVINFVGEPRTIGLDLSINW